MDFNSYGFWIILAIAAVIFLWPGKKDPNKPKLSPAQTVVQEWIEPLLSAFLLALIIITFTAQPFRIPSGSMRPTLEVDDRIIVNKFIYKFTKPKTGDIIVFVCPVEKEKDYIKRLIACPGDVIQIKELPEGVSLEFSRKGNLWYFDGQLIPVNYNYRGLPSALDSQPGSCPDNISIKKENGVWRAKDIIISSDLNDELNRLRALYLNNKLLQIIPQIPSGRCYYSVKQADIRNSLNYKKYKAHIENAAGMSDAEFVECLEKGLKVGEGYYFVLGDNSDNSMDSRYWGFVPAEYVRGRAFLTFWPIWPKNRLHLLR